MAEQLRQVAVLAEGSRVTVRVVPIAAGAHAGMAGSFGVAWFPQYRPMLYRREDTALTLLDAPVEVTLHESILARLQNVAWSQDRSVEFCLRVAADLG